MKMRFSMVAMAFALLAIPRIASAHGGVPYSTPNVIHGCRNANGVLRQITSGGCAADVVVHWNITGPAGPIGPGGPQGPAGATGATGPPGTNGTNGTNGNNGTNGTNGTPGIDGTNGTPADPPCFDNSNRYVACGNGTVTDTVTGLIWLQQANCLANWDWVNANGAAAALGDGQCGLTDGSSAGDWRLPTRDEWSATIARAVALGCTYKLSGGTPPSVTNDAGTACYGDGSGSSFAGVASFFYWSSTSEEASASYGMGGDLVNGNVGFFVKGFTLLVWPVRGGTR